MISKIVSFLLAIRPVTAELGGSLAGSVLLWFNRATGTEVVWLAQSQVEGHRGIKGSKLISCLKMYSPNPLILLVSDMFNVPETNLR